MSFRGGGGSGGRSTQRTILPFGLDYADIISSTQETEKPQLLLPINGDITEIESIIAKQSMNFTKLMSEGPFFTGNLDSIEITKNVIIMIVKMKKKKKEEEIQRILAIERKRNQRLMVMVVVVVVVVVVPVVME